MVCLDNPDWTIIICIFSPSPFQVPFSSEHHTHFSSQLTEGLISSYLFSFFNMCFEMCVWKDICVSLPLLKHVNINNNSLIECTLLLSIQFHYHIKTRYDLGTSLAVQWLGLQAPNARSMGSVPGWGIVWPHDAQCGQKTKIRYNFHSIFQRCIQKTTKNNFIKRCFIV